MSNNRLYIVDTDTGDAFLLCKSHGAGWGVFNSEMGEELNWWLDGRDDVAQSGGDYTKFKLVTENGSNIDSVAVSEAMEKVRTGNPNA